MSKKVITKRKGKTMSRRVIAGMLALAVAISGMGVSMVKERKMAKAVSSYYSVFVPQFSQTISVNHGLELDDAFDRTAFTKQYTAGTTIGVSASNGKRNAYQWNSGPLSGGSSTDNTYTILVLTDKNDCVVYAERMIHIYASAYYIKDANILYGSMPSDITDNRLSSLGTNDIASVDYSSYGYKAGFAGASVVYNMCNLSPASDKTSLDYNIYTYQCNVGSALSSYSTNYVTSCYHINKFNANNILSFEGGYYFLEGSPTTTALENLYNNKTKNGDDLFTASGYTFCGWTTTYRSEYTLSNKNTVTSYTSLDPSTNGARYYPVFISKTPKVSITVNDNGSYLQSVTLSATDDKSTSGGLQYYFGTSYSPTGYTATSSDGSFAITKGISSAGTYYFTVRDEDGYTARASVTCYDVTMNLNGGSATYGSIKYTNNFTITRAKGKTITLPTAGKSGYIFQNWSGNTGTYTVNGNVTLTASYQDSKAPTPLISIVESSGLVQNLTLSATDNEGLTAYYFGTSSCPGSGDYTSVNSTKNWNKTTTVSTAGTYYLFTKDAEGNENSASIICHSVTMNPNGGSTIFSGTNYSGSFVVTRAKGKTITLPTASKSGYTFQNWSGNTGTYTINGNATLTASYRDSKAPIPSIVTVESGGQVQNLTLSATDNEGITAYYFGTSSSPSSGNYTIVSSTKNWSINVTANSAGIYYLFAKDAEGNINSTSITCYAVTMNPNGGSTIFGGASYSNSFTVVRTNGASITLPSATKSGYRFTGWSGKTGAYTINSTTTLTAEYEDTEQSIASITVNRTSDRTQSLTLSGTDNEGITAYYFGTSSSPSAGSYTSVSSTKNWSKNATVSTAGTYYLYTKDAAGNISSAKSVTCYKVNLSPHGGTCSYNGTSYDKIFSFIKAEGTLINLPSAKRNGYTFDGWSGHASVYTVNANDILTAAWTPVEYSISYDLEEGKLKKANPSVYTIETNDFTLNNPEKDGYSFDGWTGSNGESTSKEVTVAKGTTGNLEFTANWTHLYDYNADTKSLVLYSGSEETIADVMSKHPEVESIMVEADVDAGAISFPIFTSLKSITVSAGNKDYVSENGILYDANMKMLYCPAAHEDNPSVSKKCTEITEKAFKNSTVITLNIPYSVKKICSGAFENCSKLTEITIKNPNCTLEEESIPATIKTVYGFEDSSVIQYSVKNHIPYKALTTLDGEFFADEVTMTSFHVPDNITDIGRSAFVGCKNLTEISLGTVSSIGAYAFARTSISNEENGGVVSLPDTVENVAEGAFNKCDAIKKIRVNSMTTEFAWSDTALTLPKTVIMECYYGSKAYEYATSHDYPISLLVGYEADNTEEYVSGDTDNLVSVSFGPIIKKIGENAFTGAEKLTEVSFDEKSVLETIGTEAFSETGLTFVSLPDSVTTLGTGVFKNSALTKLVVENPNCVFPDEGGLVPEGAVIKGYQNSSADVYSQTYYDSACEGFGKPAYVISFDMTGGKNGTEKLYVVNGDKIPSIEVPEREDYDFAGYYVQENGRGTKYFDAEGNSVKDWDSTTNITLYAAWNHQTYTVVYDGNGATEGTMENSVFDTNTEVTLSKNTYKKTGSSFLGWSTDKNAVAAEYDNKETINALGTVGDTITLYAIWESSYYTVKFNSNDNTGTTLEQTMEVDATSALKTNEFTRENYTFLGWSKNSSATTPDYRNKESVKNLAKSGGTITLYAVWAEGIIPEHTIRYNANGGEMNLVTNTFFEGYGTSITSEKPVRKGFVFSGWSTIKGSSQVKYNADDAIDSCEDVVLYAVWSTEGDTEYKIITYVQKTDGSYREDIQVCRAEYGTELTLVENVDFIVEDGWYVNMVESRLYNTIDTGTEFKIYLDRYKIYEERKEKPDVTPVPTAIAPAKKESGLVSKVSQTLNPKKSGGKKPTAVTTGNVIYKIPGNTATVCKAFSRKISKVTIPKTIKVNGKSYKVTSITKNAFKGCKKLKKISIRANIQKVEKSAFAGIYKKAVFKIPKKSYRKLKKLLARKNVGYKKTMKIKK